jgi:hypothetical protein
LNEFTKVSCEKNLPSAELTVISNLDFARPTTTSYLAVVDLENL